MSRDLGTITVADIEAAEEKCGVKVDGHIVLLCTVFHDRNYPSIDSVWENPLLTGGLFQGASRRCAASSSPCCSAFGCSMFPPKYADRKFWSHPPKQRTGDTGPNRIYLAVGKTLSQWEQLEVFMAKLFGTFNGPNAIAATRAYGTLNGTAARADALRYAGEPYFAFRGNNPAFRKQLAHILTAYSYAAFKRNDIGHGTVTRYINNDDGVVYGYFLTPPDYASRKIDLIPDITGSVYDHMIGSLSYALRAKDIMVQYERFRGMMFDIIAFSKELWNTYDFPALGRNTEQTQ